MPEPVDEDGPPSLRRALATRPFALLWGSQLISQSGDFVFEVALLWLVLQLTGSVFAVGLVVTATLVPAVLLGPTLGVYVDRWNRRRILIATNVFEGLLIAVLAAVVLGHAADLDLLIAVVLGLGAAAQFVRITATALVPQTVGRHDLPAANGLLSFSSSFNQIVGLSIGGIVVAALGTAVPIEYDAITFFVAAALMVATPSTLGAPEPPTGDGPRHFRAELSEGFRYLRAKRYLVELIAVGAVINFFGNAIEALFAPYADLVLHGGAVTYGLLGAAVAVGSLVGALAVGKIDTRRSVGRFLFGGATVVAAVIALLGLTRSIPIALVETLVIGGFLSVTNIPLLTLVQAKVPGRVLGRVMATLMSMILLAAPFGSLFAGSLASATSISGVFVLSGVLMLGALGIGYASMRELRTIRY